MKRISLLFALVITAGAVCAQDVRISSGAYAQPVAVITDGGYIYVSNMAGDPQKKDGNGWITRTLSTGKAVKWADGLNAPKGMALYGGSLYVTDIDELVRFSLLDGSIQGRIAVDGARALGDVESSPEGILYIADLLSASIFSYDTKDGKLSTIIAGLPEAPNALYYDNGQLYIGTWARGLREDWTNAGAGSLWKMDVKTGAITLVSKAGIGRIDGLTRFDADNLLATDHADGKLLKINMKTGAAEPVAGPSGAGGYYDDGALYSADTEHNTVDVNRLRPAKNAVKAEGKQSAPAALKTEKNAAQALPAAGKAAKPAAKAAKKAKAKKQ